MSGLRLIPDSDHKIEPIEDPWYTQNGGLRASPLNPYGRMGKSGQLREYPTGRPATPCQR
jgi:hypothetical protein